VAAADFLGLLVAANIIPKRMLSEKLVQFTLGEKSYFAAAPEDQMAATFFRVLIEKEAVDGSVMATIQAMSHLDKLRAHLADQEHASI
jgi:hypothetical protein